jgi:hypothetical protein
MRIFLLLLVLAACDKPDRHRLIECPPWAGSACVTAGSAVAAPKQGSAEIGPLERLTAEQATAKPAAKHRASSGGGRSASAASIPPDAPPARTRGLANGVACTFSSDCASGECDYGACASASGDKKLGNGVACTYDSDCASGDCTYQKCASKGYSKDLGTGVACTYDDDCASHHCNYNKCADD